MYSKYIFIIYDKYIFTIGYKCNLKNDTCFSEVCYISVDVGYNINITYKYKCKIISLLLNVRYWYIY